MICQESIKDELPIVWDISTPTSDHTNYEDEDASIPTEEEFPTWLYKNINAKNVEQIPDLIDGFKLYVVNTTLEDYSDDTADLQYFNMKTSSKAKYAGIQKGGVCQG